MKPLSVFEKFQKSLSQEPSSVWDRSRANTSSPSLLGLTERISNMEQVLAIQGVCVGDECVCIWIERCDKVCLTGIGPITS